MKKIGIMTFHRAINYGAVLQAFALQSVLEDNYDVSIINYHCPKIEGERQRKTYGVKAVVKKLIKSVLFRKYVKGVANRVKRFEAFEKNYLKTSKLYSTDTINSANNQYDAFIAGSDQVWNLKLTNGDSNYFLSFADNKKRFSYAASFGGCKIDSKDVSFEQLTKFNTLLLREKSGCEMIKNAGINDIPVSVVSDPVFLIKKEQWVKKLGIRIENSKPYIVVYAVARQTNLYDFAQSLAKKYDCQVKFVNLYGGVHECPDQFEDLVDVGPIEFLQLLLNAKYVVTTSFHAMSFSLIFNVPFFYELNKEKENNNNRLENIAEIFNVGDMEIKGKEFDKDVDYNWDRINGKLDEYRKESIDILFDSLKILDNENE